MSFSSPAKQKISAALGTYAANELEAMIAGMGGPVVHLENEETILGAKMFSVSIGVNGIRYSWPHENRVGVLANDGDGNLRWQELVGSGTVSEVGLIGPPEFLVGEPVRTSGNLRFEKAIQQGGTVYAGPLAGGTGRPSFRKLAVSDLPEVPPSKVVKLQEALDQKADVALVKRSQEESSDALARKVETATFTATTADLGRRIADLARDKVDVAVTTRDRAGIHQALAKKVEREEFERRLEAIVQRLDEIVKLLGEKVSTAAPKLQAAAEVLDLNVADGSNVSCGHNKGTKLGLTRHQKLSFYGLPPVPQPSGDVITALANLGLVGNPSLWMSDVVGLVERLEAIEQRVGGGG